jgi:cytochrome c-type biogenesis protein CcmH/NrfG
MAWLPILLLAILALLALWKLARFDRAALQLAAAALLLAMAGYAWQGNAGLAGSPRAAAARAAVPDSAFATLREPFLGRFDVAGRWLTIAEMYQRKGDTEKGVKLLSAALREHPRDPDLWLGMGNALLLHGGGALNPASELAFRRAAALAPGHPAPEFFYGLALAQSGRFREAESRWEAALAAAPADAGWRPIVEERLELLRQLILLTETPPPEPDQPAQPDGAPPGP